MAIVLYGRTTSFNVQKVLWLLEELNLDYTHTELGGRFGGLDSEAFKTLNPMQKIPVLVDRDKPVWESHTILRYLAASYGDETWHPDCPYRRSLYDRWMDWSQTRFQPAFMAVFWGFYRKPPDKRDMSAVQVALKSCENCIQLIGEPLSKSTFLAGNHITLADIVVGAVFYRLTEQGLTIDLPKQVEAWYQTLSQRPGYKKWVMSDFSELKGREDF